MAVGGALLARTGLAAAAMTGSRQVADRALSPNFRLAEFTRTGTGLPNVPDDEAIANLSALVHRVLEPWRQAVGPLRVTSGYRSALVNAAVRGADGSQHTTGQAADVAPTQTSSNNAFRALAGLVADGRIEVDQAILYAPERGGHVHVSFRRGGSNRRQFLFAPASGGYRPWTP